MLLPLIKNKQRLLDTTSKAEVFKKASQYETLEMNEHCGPVHLDRLNQVLHRPYTLHHLQVGHVLQVVHGHLERQEYRVRNRSTDPIDSRISTQMR